MWFDKLDNRPKERFNEFKVAFQTKFKIDEDTMVKITAKAWTDKQKKEQSVDSYIDQVELEARRAGFTEEQLGHCIKNGFRGYIRRALTGKELATVDAIRKAARAVETMAEESDDDENAPKRLIRAVEKLTVELHGNNARQVDPKPPQSPQRVRFDEDAQELPDIGRNGPLPQERRTWRPQQVSGQDERGRTVWRGNWAGNGSMYQSGQNRPVGQNGPNGQYTQNSQYRQNSQNRPNGQYGQNDRNGVRNPWRDQRQYGNPNFRGRSQERPRFFSETCGKCGRRAHMQGMRCPADQGHCLKCGNPGHFAPVCRTNPQ
jgi:hypothetical protein